jgi:hypothetical protein
MDASPSPASLAWNLARSHVCTVALNMLQLDAAL